MTATTNHYELIVLGSDLAGLVTAALVARRGKRVLVIPEGPADAEYRLGRRGLPLDVAPTVHLDTPAAKQVYEELGLWTQLRRDHRPIEGQVHWALAGHRLDLDAGESNLMDEAGREWPSAPLASAVELRDEWVKAVDVLIDDLLASEGALTADGFWARRFQARVAGQMPDPRVDEFEPLPSPHPLREAEGAIVPWLTHLSPAQLGKAPFLRQVGLWRRGPLDHPGGQVAVRRQLLHRIELKSGEVKPNLRVSELLLKRGRLVGVGLLGKQERYGCDAMLIATDPRRLLQGPLDPELLPRPLAVTLAGIHTVAARYVLHLDVDDRGLGPGLSGTVICVPPRRPDEDGRVIGWDERQGHGLTYVRLRPGPEEGVTGVTITRIVDPTRPLTDLREEVLNELEQRGVLPFVRRHVRFMHSPHDGREATDGAGNPVEGLAGDTTLRLPMDPILASDSPPSLGLGLMPHSSGIRNLFFASRLSLPGLGMEGEFATGLAAANLFASQGRPGLARTIFFGR